MRKRGLFFGKRKPVTRRKLLLVQGEKTKSMEREKKKDRLGHGQKKSSLPEEEGGGPHRKEKKVIPKKYFFSSKKGSTCKHDSSSPREGRGEEGGESLLFNEETWHPRNKRKNST